MKRIVVVCLLTTALVSTSSFVEAQQPKKVWRLGFISSVSLKLNAHMYAGFLQGLHDLGYIEGKNIVIE